MYVQIFLATISEPIKYAPSLSNNQYLSTLLILYATALAAGTMSKKQLRKLKRKLVWQYAKTKFKFNSKDKKNNGLLILAIILGLSTFGVAIALGMLKQFLIAIGAIILLYILFTNASAQINNNQVIK